MPEIAYVKDSGIYFQQPGKEVRREWADKWTPCACNTYNYSPYMGAGKTERDAILDALGFSQYCMNRILNPLK
jgi:DNA-directed RNA polymerase subunit N (RpoN/RPB10)